MFESMFGNKNIFGKIGSGMCRLTMNGEIAVKTSNGYKSYNVKKKRLVNQSNFVFDIGEDFFFVIPTNNVKIGDIILVQGKPHCVINVDNDRLEVINYEDSTIENIISERHVFLGNTYFYGKIVSLFGNTFGKKAGTNKLMQMMMMSQMFKGNNGGNSGFDMNTLMMMNMMNGGMNDFFDGLFDVEDGFVGIDVDEEAEEDE